MSGCDVEQRSSVLVVDDDADIRKMLAEILELEGYEAIPAANGREALGRLRAGVRPSLILLDLMMPGMNGWQFRSEQVKDPDLASIPVVVLTGDGQADRKATDVGAVSYLRKPLDVEALLGLIERYEGNRNS
jgi:CheY-like chemotaxis protein